MRHGRFHIGWLLALCAGLWLAACEPTEVTSAPDGTGSSEGDVTIYVTSNGWHSEIVLPRALVPAGAIPEASDFSDALYLSFGWGDETYYTSRTKTLGMTLSAALVPTPAVVHLAGLLGHPRDVFPADEVVAVRLSSNGLRQLIAYLDASFDRETARETSQGLYLFSRFYPATGEFHLFNTCNTWTARGLQQGGLAIQVFGTSWAEDLMAQVRRVAGAWKAPQPAAEVHAN